MIRVTCAIIIWEGKVFAARRQVTARHALKWEFPGGKVETGESDRECLERELKEELDLQVTVGAGLTPVHHCYEDFTIVLVPFVCTSKNPKYTLKEHIAAGWFTVAELSLLDWADADRKVLEKVKTLLS
ncbi:MAG TPA: (deoxy)nucleoside triphosphate pyrophosphohydrolase [Bacteroidales bacterium]|nr:(deoxy)nucleoside triphosphate pyrophosphohydrolase [Bacteroidales bacterium]